MTYRANPSRPEDPPHWIDMAQVWAEALIERIDSLWRLRADFESRRREWDAEHDAYDHVGDIGAPPNHEWEWVSFDGRVFAAEQAVFTAASHLARWTIRNDHGKWVGTAMPKDVSVARNFYEHNDERWHSTKDSQKYADEVQPVDLQALKLHAVSVLDSVIAMKDVEPD